MIMINVNQYHSENENDIKSIGVYKLYHLIDKRKLYIGSTRQIKGKSGWIGFKVRLLHHINDLINKKHANRKLQNLVNKYGLDGIRLEIVELCNVDICIEREQYWIDYYESWKKGYNIKAIARGGWGKEQTPEQIKKRTANSIATKRKKYKNSPWPIASIQGTREGWDRNGIKQRAIKPEQIETIRQDMLINELTPKEAADKYGISDFSIYESINNYYKHLDWSFLEKRSKFSKNTIGRIKELYESGETLAEISRLLGINQGTLWNIVTKRNMKKVDKTTKYKYRGVRKSGRKWVAQLGKTGMKKILVTKNTIEEAALAYNEIAWKYLGNRAILNIVYKSKLKQ